MYALYLPCRCKSSTRHYRIVWDGKQFTFGLGKFPTLEALQSHFNHKPIISGDSGKATCILYIHVLVLVHAYKCSLVILSLWYTLYTRTRM